MDSQAVDWTDSDAMSDTLQQSDQATVSNLIPWLAVCTNNQPFVS